MNDFKAVIQLAVALREVFETAVVLMVLCGVATALIVVDMYMVYSQLLPFESLWTSLSVLDQGRLVLLPVMFGLATWYGLGAFCSYSNRYVFR